MEKNIFKNCIFLSLVVLWRQNIQHQNDSAQLFLRRYVKCANSSTNMSRTPDIKINQS